MCGNDHAALWPLFCHHFTQQLKSQAVWQAHVRNHGIKPCFLQQLARLCQVTGGFNPVTFPQQGQLVQGAQIRLIVNDQDVCRLLMRVWGTDGGRHGVQTGKVSKEVGFSAMVSAAGLKTTKNSLPSSAYRVARW